MTVAVAVGDSVLSPLDLKEMALQQILCQQVQKLLHSPGLRIGFKQVGDLKLGGTCQPHVALSGAAATLPPGI
jgi:hypothetical protein